MLICKLHVYYTSGKNKDGKELHTKKPIKFSDLFNATYFIHQVYPCIAVEYLPPGEVIVPTKVQGIKIPWPYDYTLPALYAALRPSPQLELIVSELYARTVRVAGPRWAGIHLRIEKDWWYDSGFCNLNRLSLRTTNPPPSPRLHPPTPSPPSLITTILTAASAHTCHGSRHPVHPFVLASSHAEGMRSRGVTRRRRWLR